MVHFSLLPQTVKKKSFYQAALPTYAWTARCLHLSEASRHWLWFQVPTQVPLPTVHVKYNASYEGLSWQW